jgi:hypothetical protein
LLEIPEVSGIVVSVRGKVVAEAQGKPIIVAKVGFTPPEITPTEKPSASSPKVETPVVKLEVPEEPLPRVGSEPASPQSQGE